MTHQAKLDSAIEYLRSRNKYIVDPKCDFIPTKAVQTDVAETIRAYRTEVQKLPAVKLVRKK